MPKPIKGSTSKIYSRLIRIQKWVGKEWQIKQPVLLLVFNTFQDTCLLDVPASVYIGKYEVTYLFKEIYVQSLDYFTRSLELSRRWVIKWYQILCWSPHYTHALMSRLCVPVCVGLVNNQILIYTKEPYEKLSSDYHGNVATTKIYIRLFWFQSSADLCCSSKFC